MLIDEIIELLGKQDGSIINALLQTKILLHKIGKQDLVEWVNNELNGYPNEKEVPPYRIVSSRVLANTSNGAWQFTAHPIPIGHLSPQQQEDLTIGKMRESLAVLERLTAGEKKLMRPLPMEVNRVLDEGLGNGYRIQQAWCDVNKPEVQNIAFQVRSRLLDFLLELRDQIGEGATESNIKEKSNSVDTRSLFNNAIFGANTTIVVGDGNIQTVRSENHKGDLDSLARTLISIGVPNDEIENLKTAINEDKANGQEPSFNGKAGSWFTKLLGRAAKGGLKIGVDVVSSTVSKALTTYFGAG